MDSVIKFACISALKKLREGVFLASQVEALDGGVDGRGYASFYRLLAQIDDEIDNIMQAHEVD